MPDDGACEGTEVRSHFGFHIPEVIGFEGFPLLGSVGRIMATGTAVLGFCRGTEIADKVFAFFQLLLFHA